MLTNNIFTINYSNLAFLQWFNLILNYQIFVKYFHINQFYIEHTLNQRYQIQKYHYHTNYFL